MECLYVARTMTEYLLWMGVCLRGGGENVVFVCGCDYD